MTRVRNRPGVARGPLRTILRSKIRPTWPGRPSSRPRPSSPPAAAKPPPPERATPGSAAPSAKPPQPRPGPAPSWPPATSGSPGDEKKARPGRDLRHAGRRGRVYPHPRGRAQSRRCARPGPRRPGWRQCPAACPAAGPGHRHARRITTSVQPQEPAALRTIDARDIPDHLPPKTRPSSHRQATNGPASIYSRSARPPGKL